MPMKLNVGLSHQRAEANADSRGGSIHLELEVDASVLADQHRLHKRIRQVFHLLRVALAEELDGHGHATDNVDPAAVTTNGNTNDTASVRHDGVTAKLVYGWRRPPRSRPSR